ncbi:MAG: nucleotidyl transferase AbiEii/AbiGii toxin family protein [Leptonema sp. (in: Bacteria)]|nr:nucleotidyl transferase AbiEii/AbiGii toxin family protein [Leptonema sp. (in: bacteria)]
MKCVSDLKLPFFLTGGTALSRFYLNHRYSDDLDFSLLYQDFIIFTFLA